MYSLKKLSVLAAATLVAAAAFVSGCGSNAPAGGTETTKNTVVTVAATPVPHSEILNEIKPLLAKEGIDLKIIEFTALADKEVDATFHQHLPFLEKFNAEHNTNLISAGNVHIEPMGVYSHKIKTLSDLSLKAKVAIPNDPSNGGRALLILQAAGLIKLKDGGTVSSTVQDITDNPKQLQFSELDAAQVPRAIDDVDIAVINTNFALEAGLNPLKDSLFLEAKDSPYANILAIRAGDESRPEIQKLLKALQSPEVKKFIEDKYKGAILPSF